MMTKMMMTSSSFCRLAAYDRSRHRHDHPSLSSRPSPQHRAAVLASASELAATFSIDVRRTWKGDQGRCQSQQCLRTAGADGNDPLHHDDGDDDVLE